MSTGLTEFPFSLLKLPAGEAVRWNASNPTFHRSWDYGLALTGEAFYLFDPFWLWFARWQRLPLASLKSAEFRDSRWSPCLVVRCSEQTIRFRTPLDRWNSTGRTCKRPQEPSMRRSRDAAERELALRA